MDFFLIGLVGHHSIKTETPVGSLHRWEVTKRGKEYPSLEGTATIGFNTRMPFDPLSLKERNRGITECHPSYRILLLGSQAGMEGKKAHCVIPVG